MVCEYHSRKDEWKTWYPGVLYLCPELDIVHISGFEHFVESATDVYNNDRDLKGLLNLAIGERTFTSDQLPHLDRDAAKAAVYRLQRLVFEAPVIGISRDKKLIEMPWSVPCCGSTTTFDRLPTDRRELDTLPLHVAMHADIQWRRRIWRRFLAKAEIDISRCKFGEKELMLNLMHPGDDKKDETDWENALHKIQDAWIPWPPAPTPDYVPPMVTGFWMVPWKALPKHGHEDPYEPYFVDITEYPPELCVAQPGIQLDIGDFRGPVSEWQHPAWRNG